MHPVSAFQKRVYLLVGQRGSGDTSCYDGTQEYAWSVLRRLIRFKLSARKEVNLIIDAWTERSEDRRLLIERLRAYGATRIVALYFITPRDLVSTWFWLKPGVAKIEEMKTRQGENLVFFPSDGPARDYDVFHELAKSIESDGFDEVIRVDPRQDLIVLR